MAASTYAREEMSTNVTERCRVAGVERVASEDTDRSRIDANGYPLCAWPSTHSIGVRTAASPLVFITAGSPLLSPLLPAILRV